MEVITTFIIDLLSSLFIVTLIIGGGVGILFLLKELYSMSELTNRVKKRLEKEENIFLHVKIPPTNEKKEDAMGEFLHSLHRLLPDKATFSLELASSNQFLRFYIVTTPDIKHIVESQLFAQYPDAEVEQVKDYLPQFDKHTAFSELKLKRTSLYPMNIHTNIQDSILANLSAILAKTEKGEQLYMQLALHKVGSKFWHRGFHAVYHKFFGKKQYADGNPHPFAYKLEKDLFMGKIRFAYIASDRIIAESRLETLLSLFKVMKSGFNEFVKRKYYFSKDGDQLFRARLFGKGDLWTTAELATLFHFPYKGTIVANVIQTTSKRAPAPDILPREGLANPKEVSFFGETNYRNERYKFGIKRVDRRRHMYVVGKTGSGKSRLLQLLLVSDILNGDGCCLIDPHGDLAEELLMFIPKERIKDVIYVNPSDREFPIGFNPLEPVENYEIRQHLSRFFISIFKKLFAADWNPRMEHLIRYITLALLETPDSNILGIPRILSDTSYRQRVIKQIQDPVVKSFWTNEFSASNEQFISAAAVPLMNKVGQFISNPIIRNMVGQQSNMLDFEKFMNKGKIVIINLSKGKLGEENAALLGSMFITKIQQAALARAKIKEEERRDFYFYVDEFQNFATDAFSSILSEARKYRLDLTIAHQYIAQLPEDVKATAFGNVGTIITFAVGGDDAAYLSKEFSPTFTPEDMISLNVREMYIKMSIDGKLTRPFSARTIDAPKPKFDYSDEIINYSRLTYGKNQVSVENEIKRWSEATEVIGTAKGDSFPEPIL